MSTNFSVHLYTSKDEFQHMLQVCAKASRLSHNSKGDAGGARDIELLSRLVRAGDEHSKSLRGITLLVAIDAPRYFWHEFVTYRMGCEQLGSESTMHGQEHRFNDMVVISEPEKTDDICCNKANIPEGLMQERIFSINYQALRHIYKQRRHHKLREWQWFCDWIENEVFCSEYLITIGLNT